MTITAFLSKHRNSTSAQSTAVADAYDDRRGFRARVMVSRRVGRLLVLTCLTLSIVLSGYAVKFAHLNAMFEFRKLTLSGVDSMQSRVADYAQVLTGTSAFIAAGDEIDANSFAKFVEGLNLADDFPGIMGVGFVRPTQVNDVPALEQSLSSTYGKAIHVQPTTPHGDKMIVTHMAPLQGNESVIGLDTGFEDGRRDALEYARDSGQTVLTSRVELVQDKAQQSGFLIYQPVYSAAVSSDNSGQQQMFLGWVVAPFLGRSVLTGLADELGQGYHLTVFEGAEARRENTLFASDPQAQESGALRRDYVVDLYGRKWMLSFTSTPRFDAAYASHLPKVLLLAGASLTLLLWLALRSTTERSILLKSVADRRGRQLDAREDENRTLLETSVLAVLTLDSDGRIVFANSAAITLFGGQLDTLIGAYFKDIVTLNTEAVSSATSNAMGRVAGGGQLMLDVQANTWRTADDATQTTVLIRDVTEQQNSQMEIEALHRRYNVALRGAGIGIFEVDVDSGHAEMSETWHQIMQTDHLDEPFSHQKHFLARVHPADLPDLLAADQQCIKGVTHRSEAEYRVRFEEGWRWMYSDGLPVARGPDGRATRLIGTQVDITDLRHSRNALELSEARFRMVLEDAPLGMAVMDERGAFTEVNGALAKLCGYSADQLKNQMRLADLLSRKDYVQLSHDIRKLLRSGNSKTYHNQFRLRTRSSELRWGLFNFSWTQDKNRAENVYIAQIIDIDDQKRVDRLKSEFVATVSHELRTPLTSIKGALGLLGVTASEVMPDNSNRLLEIATVNADRLSRMVNDILDLEKLTSGEVVFESENINLHDIVSQTLDRMRPFAEKHENRLLATNTSADTEVSVDVGRFQQVLSNLVSNACKFSDPDTPVFVRYQQRDEDAVIYVENTGPPVPESFRSRVFEAFTQVDGSDTRSKGGTGLGLNIAQQIVQRMGGEIGFDQGPDGQTVFWFTCHLAIPDQIISMPDDFMNSPRTVEMQRVLHIEEDRTYADAVAEGFDGLAEILLARDITEAREMAKSEKIDAVLLDWSLQNGDAAAFLQELQSSHPNAVCISLSSAGEAQDDLRIMLHLTKSQVDVADLAERVLRAMQTLPANIAKAVM